MKILFFDCETTGTDPKVHAMHQLTGCLEVDGHIVWEFDYHIKPWEGAEIVPEALAVGGVTLEQIMAYDLPATVYSDFVSNLDKHCDRFDKKDKIFLCGYNNAAFDNQFLRSMFDRNWNKYFGSYFWSSPLDVFVLASFKLRRIRQALPDFKQGTVAKALGIAIDDTKLHNSDYDLWVLMEIYKKLI